MSVPADARIYVRPLPMDIRDVDVEDLFNKHGEVVSVKVMQGYGFVEFREPSGANRAIEELNGRQFEGRALTVEISRPRRPPREDNFRGGDRFDRPPREPRPIATHRLAVSELPPDASWQDLKDLARSADIEVVYTNVSQSRDGTGVMDFSSKELMDQALSSLNSKEVRGAPIVLTEDERGPPPPRSREGGRGGFGGRGRGGFRGGDRDRYSDRGDRYGDRGDRFGDRGDRFGDREDRGDRYGDRGSRYNDRGRSGDRYGDRRSGDRGDRRDYRDYRGRDRSQSPRRDSRGGPRDFRNDDRSDRGDRGARSDDREGGRSDNPGASPIPAPAPASNHDDMEPTW